MDCPHLGVIDIHVHVYVQDNPYLLLIFTMVKYNAYVTARDL